MIRFRIDPQTNGPSFNVSWEQDREARLHPDRFTMLLRDQVPVLEYVDWRIKEINCGASVSLLPLNAPSTNQHFTHQAALLLLAADYTGGVALASLLTGWPVLGVHPVTSRYSASMWLLKADIKYFRPSVGDLTVTAQIDPERHRRIQKRFFDGKVVIESIDIHFKNGDVLVAEANATYFARQSDRLRSEGLATDRVNTLYQLKLTSSAELIAGIRARESGQLFYDPYAKQMAGQHGMALATRFCERTPQLGGMVAARTRHLDEVMMNFVQSGGRDIVILGTGWDMRPFRLEFPRGVHFYELDFPTTLIERQHRLDKFGLFNPEGVSRTQVPIDIRTMPLYEVMVDLLPPDVPAFIAWEGMCMYFQEGEVLNMLQGMVPLLEHHDSVLWVDLVDQAAIAHPARISTSVENFMRGMQVLGEPFTFGTDSAEQLMRKVGMRALEVVSSDIYLPNNDDPVYSVYRFCVAALQANHRATNPKTFRPTRIDPAQQASGAHSIDSNGKFGRATAVPDDQSQRLLPPGAESPLS